MIHVCVLCTYVQTKERLLESERKLSEINIQAEVRLTKQVLVSYKEELQTTAKRKLHVRYVLATVFKVVFFNYYRLEKFRR